MLSAVMDDMGRSGRYIIHSYMWYSPLNMHTTLFSYDYIDGLVKDCGNSIAKGMGLPVLHQAISQRAYGAIITSLLRQNDIVLT